MLPGETIASGARPDCSGCGEVFKLEAMHSGAGYYIGTGCHNPDCEFFGEPYSREGSVYYPTRAIAQNALETGQWERRW